MKSRLLASSPLLGLALVTMACSGAVDDPSASTESSPITKGPPKLDPCLTVAAHATWAPAMTIDVHFNSGTTAYANDSCSSYVLEIDEPSMLSDAQLTLARDLTLSPAPSAVMCYGTRMRQRVYGHSARCRTLDCDGNTPQWVLLYDRAWMPAEWTPATSVCRTPTTPGVSIAGVLPTDSGYDTYRVLFSATSPSHEPKDGNEHVPDVADVIDVSGHISNPF